MPWWWWLVGLGSAALPATSAAIGIRGLPTWVPYLVLGLAAVSLLFWLSRVEIKVTEGDTGVELWAGQAHLPAALITRSAPVPRTAKSAALGRQLDPAAFVVHRPWVGPMVLAVLDDPDDPTPYWLFSTRHPDRVLSALRS